MKVAKIQDIENLADGSIIGEMAVKVKAAFDAKTGQGKYGPWRVQAAILADATGEIRASFWTNEDIKAMVGQTITIKSQGGSKGLQGLKVKLSTHSGKNELDISDKAAIYDQTKNAFEEYSGAVKANAQIAKSTGSVADAKRTLFQKAQLYVECVKAADWIRSQHELTQDHFQAVVSTLFISADKQNLAGAFPTSQAKPLELEADEIPMRAPATKDEFESENGW
jgi:hypothetical protein